MIRKAAGSHACSICVFREGKMEIQVHMDFSLRGSGVGCDFPIYGHK